LFKEKGTPEFGMEWVQNTPLSDEENLGGKVPGISERTRISQKP
jgi:hypothetical protein